MLASMRVTRERLIFLALCGVERARIKDTGAVPGLSVRLALAIFYEFSQSGKRLPYDRL